MTPTFVGSEPVIATSGKYEGTSILQDEQDKGLALVNALDAAQRRRRSSQVSKTGNNNVAEAFKDNVVLDYAGVAASALDAAQRDALLDLIGRVRRQHGRRPREGEDGRRCEHTSTRHVLRLDRRHRRRRVFYYRIHSPVLLIEFDHQTPVAIRHLVPGPKAPVREHIHAVVRTPNGNDYGKDLLRQHYATHPH